MAGQIWVELCRVNRNEELVKALTPAYNSFKEALFSIAFVYVDVLTDLL